MGVYTNLIQCLLADMMLCLSHCSTESHSQCSSPCLHHHVPLDSGRSQQNSQVPALTCPHLSIFQASPSAR